LSRVAITGAGAVSPLGRTLRDFYRALGEARPGIRRLAPELAQASGVQVAASIDWSPAPILKEGEAANLDRGSQFALAAAAEALGASEIDLERLDRGRCGVYWGTGMGGANIRSRWPTSWYTAQANGACARSPS
jgi:3-oxoacyl-[acyl-carrier-protein] synthase II